MRTASLPDLSRARRLLIIRLSSIGDVVQALPVSAALGEAFPNLEMTWVVEEMSAQIVTGNPYIKEVIALPRSRWKKGRLRSPDVWREYLAFLADLRRRQFDVALDLQGYAKSALIALGSGAARRFGWHALKEGANLVSQALPRRAESVHRVDCFLDVARAFGAELNPVRFPLFIPAEDRARARERLCSGGLSPDRPYVVLNPATGSQIKRWSAANYAQLAVALAERHRLPCALIGSGKDRALNAEVCAQFEAEGGARSGVLSPTNLAGETSLKQLAAVLEGCAVHVSGDTGSAHIAAALNRPAIALYGPTDPALWGPYFQSANVISRRELCGAACSDRQCAFAAETGAQSADNGQAPQARCLRAITVSDVLEKVEQALNAK